MSIARGREHAAEPENGTPGKVSGDTADDIEGRTMPASSSEGDPERRAKPPRDTAQSNAQEYIDSAARRVARERLPRRRALARGIVLAAIYALGLVALVLLALAVHANTLLPPDLPFTREVQEHPSPVVSTVLSLVSAVGYFPYAEIISVATLLALVLLRLRLEAIFLLVALLADALGGLLKALVNRQRPSPTLVHVFQRIGGPSFPSGHTLHYTVFYGFLAFVLITSFRSSWLRNLLVTVCCALIALVGISRVYLGEHWLTDVLGGYLLGALFLVPLVTAYLWARAHFNSATLRPLPHPSRPG